MNLSRPNVYDYLKVCALCTMIIDHIGYFFYPESMILRVVGRYAFPVFLFLVGYNRSYRFRLSLWFRGILLQIGIIGARYLGYVDRIPLNILLAIAITRAVLVYVKKYGNFFREVLLFISSMLLVGYTDERIDYGTLSLAFALLGYWARMYGKQKKMLVLFFCIVVMYMGYMYIDRGYAMPVPMMIIGLLLFLSLGGLSIENTLLRSFSKKRDQLILWISMNALELYVIQALLLGGIFILL